MSRCPNCNETVRANAIHPENGCLLAVIARCVLDRGNVRLGAVNHELVNADVDRLWQQLGPIIDAFEANAITREGTGD